MGDGAVAVDQELLEVPGDVGRVALARLGGLQQRVQRRLVSAVHIDLGEHREVDIVGRGGEVENLGIGAGLLVPELVAGKGQDGYVVALIVVEDTQTCVLKGEASTTGDVDDQASPTAKLLERNRFARDRSHRERMESVGMKAWHLADDSRRSGPWTWPLVAFDKLLQLAARETTPASRSD